MTTKTTAQRQALVDVLKENEKKRGVALEAMKEAEVKEEYLKAHDEFCALMKERTSLIQAFQNS